LIRSLFAFAFNNVLFRLFLFLIAVIGVVVVVVVIIVVARQITLIWH